MNTEAEHMLKAHSEESTENLGVCRKAQGEMQLDSDCVKSAFTLLSGVSYQPSALPARLQETQGLFSRWGIQT